MPKQEKCSNWNRWQTDAFLKEARAFRACEHEDFANDLAVLRSLAAK